MNTTPANPRISSASDRAGALISFACVLVLGICGVAKLLALDEFVASLQTWRLIPLVIVPAVATAVSAAELGLLVVYLALPSARRHVVIGAVLLLGLFLLTIVAHLLFSDKPDCNCLGILSRYFETRSEWPWLLGKAGFLFVLGACGLWLTSSEITSGVSSRCVRAGFTLIETLIVILILGVLVSLLIPSLAGVRETARITSSLSELRQHATVFSAYSNDYQEQLPLLLDPKATNWFLRDESGVNEIHYFSTHSRWPQLFEGSYYNEDPRKSGLFFPDEQTPWLPIGFAPYAYSCSFLARPEYWRAETRTGQQQWGSSKLPSVVFPTRKVLLISQAWLYLPTNEAINSPGRPTTRSPFACVDGHAAVRKSNSFLPGMPSGDGILFDIAHSIDIPNAMHTSDGIRGVDFELR